MCDDLDQINESYVSRRAFGLMSLAAAGFASCAQAQADVVERDVEVTTPDGKADSVLFHPAGAGPWPAVLIWPDILTLRPVFRDMGRRLAAEGYTVLVPNVFYRTVKAPISDRSVATPARQALTPEAIDRDAAAYLAFLDAQPQTDKRKKAGTQGYCMGGPFTFRTAAALPDRIGAAASFHGAGLASAQPTSPHLLIPKTKAQFVVAIAASDDTSDPAAKDTLKAAFAAAGRPATVEVYAGASHGWTVKDNNVYNEAAAEKAWAELLALYKRALV